MPGRRPRRRVSAGARQGSHRRYKKGLMFAGVGIALTLVVVLAVVFVGGNGGPSSAPNFTFSLYQGFNEVGGVRETTLSRLQGKPVVLNFWAALCPPCRAEMPEFQRFYEEFQDRVLLLGIDVGPFTGFGDGSHREAETLLRDLGITYPAGFTNDSGVPRKFRIVGMPTTVFINSSGEIFEKRTGGLNRADLARVTGEMLKAEAASQ